MPRLPALLITLLALLATPAMAQDLTVPAANDDLELGRRYLQCTGYWGMSAGMLKAMGQTVDLAKLKKVRDLNELAAFTLMGDTAAKAENGVQKMKFMGDLKATGAAKALEDWSAACDRLVAETYPAIAPRVEAYAKARRESAAAPASDSAAR